MEYLTCTSELTPMMIHLRVTADERIIYRISGLLENEDPNIYYLLDTFHLHPDLCPPLSAEGAKHLKDITVWHSAENAFYLFDNVAYT